MAATIKAATTGPAIVAQAAATGAWFWRWILVAIGEAPSQREADSQADAYQRGYCHGFQAGYEQARQDHLRLLSECE